MRLNGLHVALLGAVLLLGFRQGRVTRIKVSRGIMMRLSHIYTVPTYHKYLKELQLLGYFAYRPSYHPKMRSEIDLLHL